jgi:hypothetical protein
VSVNTPVAIPPVVNWMTYVSEIACGLAVPAKSMREICGLGTLTAWPERAPFEPIDIVTSPKSAECPLKVAPAPVYVPESVWGWGVPAPKTFPPRASVNWNVCAEVLTATESEAGPVVANVLFTHAPVQLPAKAAGPGVPVGVGVRVADGGVAVGEAATPVGVAVGAMVPGVGVGVAVEFAGGEVGASLFVQWEATTSERPSTASAAAIRDGRVIGFLFDSVSSRKG